MKHLYASKKMEIESDLNYKCDLCGYETTSFQSISGKVSLDGVRSYCGDFNFSHRSRDTKKQQTKMLVYLSKVL